MHLCIKTAQVLYAYKLVLYAYTYAKLYMHIVLHICKTIYTNIVLFAYMLQASTNDQERLINRSLTAADMDYNLMPK